MKVFFDEAWLPAGAEPVVALYPFLRPEGEDDDGPTASRYDRWLAHGRDVLERVSLEGADAAIFPAKWENVAGRPDAEQVAVAAATEAAAAGVPLAVFFWSDSTEPVELPGAIIFRTSLTHSGRRPGEHAMPAWSEDLVDVHLGGSVVERPRRERPTVGFCGFARPQERVPARARRASSAAGRPMQYATARCACWRPARRWTRTSSSAGPLWRRRRRRCRGTQTGTSRLRRESRRERLRPLRPRCRQLLLSPVRDAQLRSDPGLRRHGLRAAGRRLDRLALALRLGRRIRVGQDRRARRRLPRGTRRRFLPRAAARVPPRLAGATLPRGLVRASRRVLRTMRIVVVDTYYGAFLRSHYGAEPDLADAPYDEQRAALMARRFGTSDFYSQHLRALGHDAVEVVANCCRFSAAGRGSTEGGRRCRATSPSACSCRRCDDCSSGRSSR